MVTRFFSSGTQPSRRTPLLERGVALVKRQAASHPAMRIVAALMLVIGALLTAGSIFADQINLTAGGDGLGWKQLIGAVVGLVLALLGGAWLVQPPTVRRRDHNPQEPRRSSGPPGN